MQALHAACRLAKACLTPEGAPGNAGGLLSAAPLLLGCGRQLLEDVADLAPGSSAEWALWHHVSAAAGLARMLLRAPAEAQAAAFPPGHTVIWLDTLVQCTERSAGVLHAFPHCAACLLAWDLHISSQDMASRQRPGGGLPQTCNQSQICCCAVCR